MKIQITLHNTTLTENGRTVPAGTFEAEYNAAHGVHGYDSSNIDKYDSLRLNERLIIRAICNAEDASSDTGVGNLRERTCSIRLFFVN